MKLNPSIKNMSNEYIFFTDQTALTFRICLVIPCIKNKNSAYKTSDRLHYQAVLSWSRGTTFAGISPVSIRSQLCEAHYLILARERCDMLAVFDSVAFEALLFVCFTPLKSLG